jgi:hypothetical protein
MVQIDVKSHRTDTYGLFLYAWNFLLSVGRKFLK